MIQGRLANAEMERVAGLLVADLGAKGVLLDYTPQSLRIIDQVLANYGHSKGNGDQNMGLVELVGAYFGEVFRRNLGGSWYENVPPDGATGLLLNERHEVWIWCHAVVYKQLEQGNKILLGIYPDVAARLKKLSDGREFGETVTYQLGWATLPGLRGLSVGEFRATATETPDNERGVTVEFASDEQRDTFLREIEAAFARCRFTNAADAFDSVKVWVVEHSTKSKGTRSDD